MEIGNITHHGDSEREIEFSQLVFRWRPISATQTCDPAGPARAVIIRRVQSFGVRRDEGWITAVACPVNLPS